MASDAVIGIGAAVGVSLLCAFGLARGDVPPEIGGGNIPARGDPAKFRALNALGAGLCRIPVDGRIYWNAETRSSAPEKIDAAVLMAHRHGVAPMLLFEFYTRWHGEIGGRAKWRAVGRAFARRFAPDSTFLRSQGIRGWGVTFYSAFNEPLWRSNNPKPIDSKAYAAAMEALADGVHEVSGKLHVSPGGYMEVPLFQNRNPYIKAVAPLYNAGKLYAIDIHRYWDVDYVPMDKGRAFSLQAQFDQVKKQAGITADVRFYTTEMNFKKRKVTEAQAAEGFLTALWDALTVVGRDGRRVTQFVLPWNIFHTTKRDPHYGLCTQLAPWTPTARGKVLASVCRLTKGMAIVSCDPKKTGVTVLEGRGRKLWVWQNRKGWTDRPGTEFTLRDVPKDARRLEVHAWDGLRRAIELNGRAELSVTNLKPDQTYMFLATEK